MRQGSDERIAVTSALASMLAALTLAPLVQGWTWMFVAAITVVSAMVTGIIGRQLMRWWPGVLLAQLTVQLLTLLVLFARSRVLEGADALVLLRDLVEAGLQVTREQAPPVESTQGIILLVAGSAGLIAVLVDLLAATLRQPALAGLPLLAVYCVPAALLDGGLPWYYFTLAAAGFLLLLTADSGDRVRSWGRVLAAGGGARRTEGGPTGGGRAVGAVALAMAVAVPTLVPGLSNQIIGGSGNGAGGGGNGRTITRINPILDLRKDLAAPQNTALLRYTTEVRAPEPLRIVTSDEFDGRTWAPSTTRIPTSQNVEKGLPSPQGLSRDVETTSVQTVIDIGGNLRETYLPLPYPAQEVQVDGDWLFDAQTLNVIGDGVTTRNKRYTVTHLLVQPSAEQLRDAPAPAQSVATKYEYLPPNLPAVVGTTARDVAGTGSDYERAVRLQRWFRDGDRFTYSLNAPEENGSSAIVDFLEQRRGYCVHFASAMAVMARSLGIPARVAVGFLPGERQSNGSMVISAHDAHAWPELYFEGVGWVRFEPTPRSGLAVPPVWSNPPPGVLPEDAVQSPEASAQPSTAPSEEATTQAPDRRVDKTAPETSGESGGPAVPWRPLVVVLVVLLGLAAPRMAATLSSHRRWNRATTVPALAEAAWDDLRLELGDLGVRWASAWTPRAVQRRLLDDGGLGSPASAALNRLTDEIENARYAPPTEDLGRTAAERGADVSAVAAAVAASAAPAVRWRARLWPRSGVERLTGLWPRMNTAADRAGRQASALGSQVRDRVAGGGRGSEKSAAPADYSAQAAEAARAARTAQDEHRVGSGRS